MQNTRRNIADYKMSLLLLLLLLLLDAVETKSFSRKYVSCHSHNRHDTKNSRHFISGSNNNIRAHRRGKRSASTKGDLIKKIPSANISYRSRAKIQRTNVERSLKPSKANSHQKVQRIG